jgi:hypothetical protein
MKIVPYASVVRHLSSKTDNTNLRPDSINLSWVGILYVVASLFQAGWLLFYHWEVSQLMMKLPIIGWVVIGIWCWLVVHLPYIGARMILLSRDPAVVIAQTEYQKRRLSNVIFLVALGLLLGVILFSFLPSIEDKSGLIFLSGLIFVQANMEAVLQYYDM